ncbi:MAG: molybdate ABC transporter permease subunit [Rhodospirillales bacterium]|jgi:molybdate transport system permease protein|nr:molybdate ABC transporter permease subunit [Rhodospirillales bacterium]MDP6772956.1 molybdate ABC transporter permease subunit [Rhodospirillales bacterium]
MDWEALWLSVRLGGLSVLILVPIAIVVGRWLAVTAASGKSLIEASLALPLVLPPTVLGFYLLVAFGAGSWVGRLWQDVFGHTLVFTFEGLLIASIIVNIPFAVQPIQRAFEAISPDLREAAACCGLSWWRSLWRIELPLAWPGILTGMVLTFAHTLGEFGVVLMVGGSIPGETRTIAIAIYDRVQAFDEASAGKMAAVLLLISLVTITLSYLLTQRVRRRHD